MPEGIALDILICGAFITTQKTGHFFKKKIDEMK